MIISSPTASQLPALRSLWHEAFGDTDEFLDTFEATAFDTARCRYASIDGNVAAALYWFDCTYMERPIAYIYAIATAHEFRGQGICHRLMEDTHCHLATLGYQGAILVPGDEKLFQLYEHMGYKTCCYIDEAVYRDIESTPSNIRMEIIDKYEYAKQRRLMLPEGSVIQENENLDFLETQATFYKGDDFLLAARIERPSLLAYELLGNKDIAPQLISKLSCNNGIFRTPGNSRGFAMYLPLGDATQMPSYFAFAFD